MEYQARGTAHVHGCFQLKNNPGLVEAAERVRDGQLPAYHLRLLGEDFKDFDEYEIEDDKWAFTEEHFRELSEEEIESYKNIVQADKEGHDLIVRFHDFFLTTLHPDPPSDARDKQCGESTGFCHDGTMSHPAASDPRDVMQLPPLQRQQDYCSMINASERHKCIAYGYCDCCKQAGGEGL